MRPAHRILLSFVSIAAAALPAAVSAESIYHPAPGEVGFTEHWDHFKSTRTRAQVLAEVDAARRDGTLSLIQREIAVPEKATGPAKTRQQVIDEMLNEPAAQRQARQALLTGG